MATSGPSQAFVQLSSLEEGNWLSLGRALTSVLCRGLRPYIQREMNLFYSNVTAAMTALGGGPCICVNDPSRKKNQYHDMSTCAWAQILQGVHIGNKPNWKQSDSTKWMDPRNGQWEIAKLFLSDAGGHTVIESAEDLDITGILNLLYWCNHFTVARPLIESVRQTRNTKWGHVLKSELSEVEKRAAFEAIERFLQDPVFAGDPHAQDALRDILALKCTSDVHIFKVKDLSHFEEAIRKDISGLKRKLNSLPRKESKKNEKQRARLEKQIRNFNQALKKLEKKIPTSAQKTSEEKTATSLSSLSQILVLPIVFVGISIRNVGKMQRNSFIAWIKLLLLCCCIGVLDHRSFQDGCPTEDVSVPFDTKEYNLTDYLTIARENFIGRRWLYQEIENAFHPSRQGVSGVLIIGDPGAGKSALTAQLVCSRTSSRTIHDHVLGYHLCKHSDRNTQNGGKFVRNLADMIARRLPEYGYIVTNNSYIQRSLDSDCVTLQDPVGCFEQAILSPLRRLKNKPKENWYIVIDALDECLTQSETGHSIVYLLNNKLPRFPSWVKLVMTSRNESSVSINSNSVMKFIIDPDDIRNIEDIELFLSTKLLQDGPLINQIKFWFGDDSIKNTARLISALLSKSQGNFLFVKEMLHHWETSRAEKRDPYALPETLGDLYHSYFERLYSGNEQFRPIRRVLELLVATFHPLSLKGIYEVLKTSEQNLEEHYEFKDRINGLGHFLRYGENDTVTLYHLSLTEWLTSESNKNSPFYVSKRKGHEMFCDYYLMLIAEGDKSSLLKYILTLAQHITYGGWKESYVKQFLKFPSQVVNSSDPTSNRTLLHLAATINSTDVLELLLKHFSCIDCIDNRGITPAFLAAEHGLINNLALMVRKGAKVNHKTKSLLSIFESEGNGYDAFGINDYLSSPVLQSKSKYWGSTMLHAAAHRGHLEVVVFLLDNGAFISTVDSVNLTALQIAAENGHLKVVKALYNAGAVADQTSLHHAAANGRVEVVKYLLKIGVRDRCIRCDGNFYWLKTRKHRLQSNVKTENITFSINKQCFENTLKIAEKIRCIEAKTGNTTNFGELFDDKHLIFCETALHAAVSAGHVEVVKELISSPPTALTCRDYTGRTPLHEAVRKNNSEIVKIILKREPALIHETCNYWQSVEQQNETHESLVLSLEESLEYHGDVCHCGFTPLHIAARYGHWEIGMYLIKIRGARVNSSDCFGATPLHVAACHNHNIFVQLLMRSGIGANINSRSSNGSTPLHSAAACGAADVIGFLLYFGAILSAVDSDGLSALHYTILHIDSEQLDRKIILNRTDLGGTLHLLTIDRRGHLAGFYEDNNIVKNTDHYRWLNALVSLIIRGSDIDAVDIHGRTPLHIAAANGLADAVNVLLQKKPKLELRDKFGKTPLEVAVENCTAGSKTSPFVVRGRFRELHPYLRDHEMVVYLLLSSGAAFKKCKRNVSSLLHHAIKKSKPYIAQLLFLKGASLNCKDYQGRTPLTAFLNNGGDWTEWPFKHVDASVKIECKKPFISSAFHLFCFFPPRMEENNFFQLITCDDQTCSSRNPPLKRAVENHNLKYRVIDHCLDSDGFTPLHRAAQGANLVAVRGLIKFGANLTLLSPQGQDALTLAILHSGGNVWNHILGNDELLARKDKASLVALELLHHAMNTRGFQIVCDSSKSDLTLYHLAASRGLVKFIQEIFKKKEQHQLDVNCPTRDGITPLYLAKVFSFPISGAKFNPWKEVEMIIRNHGGKTMFPPKDVEMNIIYRRLFGWIPNDLELNLRPDVRGFVSGLLSTFQNKQYTSSQCDLQRSLKEKGMEIGSLSSLEPILQELLRQLDLLNGRVLQHPQFAFLVSLALTDFKLCQLQANRILIYQKKLTALTNSMARVNVPYESQYRTVWRVTPVYLFYLMRMWHHEVFQHFSCIKKVFDRYGRLFHDDKLLRQLIAEYEESTPTHILHYICFSFKTTFQTYLLSYLLNNNYAEFTALHYNCSDFVRKRMGWTVDQPIVTGSWPLNFLFKFSTGLYNQYEHLKILNVAIEPGTHVTLHSKDIEQTVKPALTKKKGRI